MKANNAKNEAHLAERGLSNDDDSYLKKLVK